MIQLSYIIQNDLTSHHKYIPYITRFKNLFKKQCRLTVFDKNIYYVHKIFQDLPFDLDCAAI